MALDTEHCVFCKILEGIIPGAKVYEDEKVFAFLDIAPFNFGHTLVIPKTHCHAISDLEDDYRAAMINAAAKIAPAIMRATGASGYNLLLNNGQVAGQEVPHVHLHIIPRFVDDKVLLGAAQKQYEGTAMADLLAKIQEKIAKRD